jgi:hypothetical protein
MGGAGGSSGTAIKKAVRRGDLTEKQCGNIIAMVALVIVVYVTLYIIVPIIVK